MIASNDALLRRERPPASNQEWADELKCYARDRDREHQAKARARARQRARSASTSGSKSASSSFVEARSDSRSGGTSASTWVASIPPPQGPYVRPLVHHGDSNESIEEGQVKFLKPETASHPYESIEGASQDITPPFNGLTKSKIDSAPSIDPTPMAFDTAKTAPDAEVTDGDDDDRRSSDKECRRLRSFYEKEGWLPGPAPCKETRLRRRRAIRRLGLVGEEEDGRKAVLSKYAEMAELIFNVPRSVVSVIHDEREYAYFANTPPEHRPFQETACSHVLGLEEEACWVIRDWSADWRTKLNPTCLKTGHKFFAAAPLRYHGKDGSTVDFGTINLYDTVARESFDERERSLLLKLANMLVYQLATLQSEYMAKRSSTMYEASVTFLRQALMPQPTHDASRRDSSSPRRPSVPSRPVSDHPRAKSMAEANTIISGADSPPMASKSGPRNSKDAKRKAMLADQGLFNDASNTLQQLLKADSVAVVNMEDYQIFIRNSSSSTLDQKKGKERMDSKEKIIHDYMQGLPWPRDVEPVVTYTGTAEGPQILGQSSTSAQYHLDSEGAGKTLSDFLQNYLETRHFWWDREDTTDDLSNRIMQLMPSESQTALGTTFLGSDGKVRFAMFATWNEPPSSLVDSSMVALPFVWILGGSLMAALAMKKMRALEESQLSYSNLQAHELRTPLHQILAITQLLRSSMTDIAEAPLESLTSNEQIRELLPFLDAIDTSGKTLHGIVDNILSFLDLKGKETSQSSGGGTMITTPKVSDKSLEIMFEELIREAIDEDKQVRKANGRPNRHVETLFEIIPPLLGEEVSEDAGGALKRALSKLLANAYKFIDDRGCVEIYVDDVPDLLPPEGCEDIALTKVVSIIIKDNGKGMEQSFVNDKLGEPWAKEDSYATGSGKGTTVQIDVPLPIRTIPFPESSDSRRNSGASIRELSVKDNEMQINRKVALVGFDGDHTQENLGKALDRQYAKLGCDMVTINEAELIIVNGHVEEDEEKGIQFLDQVGGTPEVVFLVEETHSANQAVLDREKKDKIHRRMRRFKKPTTPSILRETLFPNHSSRLKDRFDAESESDAHANDINTPNLVGPDGTDLGRPGKDGHSGTRSDAKASSTTTSGDDSNEESTSPSTTDLSGRSPAPERKSKQLEDAVASLSLGDYFPPVPLSPKSTIAGRSPTVSKSDNGDEDTTPMPVDPGMSPVFASEPGPGDVASRNASAKSSLHGGSPDHQSNTSALISSEPKKKVEAEYPVTVLVVEDNKVNRMILVKIVSADKNNKVLEADDGDVAVEVFEKISGPIVVLLDINMPRKNGYRTCTEMRDVENVCKLEQSRRPPRAEIIAVTALGSDEDKQRGLVECGFDEWYTKPCGKSQMLMIVDQARKRLQAKAESSASGQS